MQATVNCPRVLVGRLMRGEDVIEGLTEIASRNGIVAGSVRAIGAVEEAVLGFYDPGTFEYVELRFQEPMEVCNIIGNISLRDGVPFVHVHATLSDATGKVVGGHVLPGCRVFALEYDVSVLEGDAMVRMPDRDTGLFLWPSDKTPG